MTLRVPRQESLFTVPASPGDPPALLCGECSCGHVFFPPHRFGCEACGAGPDAVSVVEYPARGTLKAFTAVHGQSRPDGKSPLVLGQVLLDSGPSIAAILDVQDQESLVAGEKVYGTLVPAVEDSKGRTVVDLLFSTEGGGR